MASNNYPPSNAIEDLFRDLPPVPPEHLPPLLNPNNGQCEFCKKFTPMSDMPVINTGIVMAHEPLCFECRNTLKDQARIVCVKCRVVVLWVDPNREATSGFEFKRRKSYHIQRCPVCAEGLEQAPVLEKVIYYRENNIPFD